MDGAAYTIDSIWRADIRIKQPARGYRFALDALLLAHFAQLEAREQALEVGCGSGVVLVLLAKMRRYAHLTGVEIQPQLAALARENLRQNSVQNAEILEADIREAVNTLPAHSFHLLLSNPPYRRAGAGRLNPQPEKAIARHEIRMKLEDLFDAAQKLLRPDGRLTVILPGFREADFDRLVLQHSLVLGERRYVHSFAAEPAAFFLATVSRVKGPVVGHPRLVIYETAGVYTNEMQRLLTAS
jgi:tRNA1Val (adenine37-N6)-methyltransferase